MRKIPSQEDIINNYFNQEKSLEETAADLGRIVLEMMHEEQFYGKHTKRMAELKRLAELQEQVLSKIEDRSNNNASSNKMPYLTVMK